MRTAIREFKHADQWLMEENVWTDPVIQLFKSVIDLPDLVVSK